VVTSNVLMPWGIKDKWQMMLAEFDVSSVCRGIWGRFMAEGVNLNQICAIFFSGGKNLEFWLYHIWKRKSSGP